MGFQPMFSCSDPFTNNHGKHGLEARATTHNETGSRLSSIAYDQVRNFGFASCVKGAQEDGLLCDVNESARVGPP